MCWGGLAEFKFAVNGRPKLVEQTFERFRLVAVSHIIRPGEARAGEGYNSFGLRNGKCPKEEPVKDTEYSAVRADTQRQRDDGNHRKSWTPAELAQAVAQVLEQCAHRLSPQ